MGNFIRRGMRLPATKTEAEAMRVVRATLENGARETGARFTEPDDDWVPIWMVLTAEGRGTFFTPVNMTSGADKRTMTNGVADFARSRGGVSIGHLNSSWVVTREDAGSEGRHAEIERHMDTHDGSTAGIAERREALMIAVYTATQIQVGLAPITRHPGPPTLGAFDFGQPDEFGGRMAEPLADALKRIG